MFFFLVMKSEPTWETTYGLGNSDVALAFYHVGRAINKKLRPTRKGLFNSRAFPSNVPCAAESCVAGIARHVVFDCGHVLCPPCVCKITKDNPSCPICKRIARLLYKFF